MRTARNALAASIALLMLCTLSGCGSSGYAEEERSDLILATTTSVLDSGILQEFVDRFEERYPYRVKAVAVGSGAALLMARQGEADVALTHEPKAEREFMEAGCGESYQELMYNDFVIVGPPGDPAGIAGVEDAAEAFETISTSGCPFISRGDASGTHAMELSIWERCRIEPSGDWYKESGQGMGYTLRIADEEGAYTLTDRATFIVLQSALNLDIVVEGDPGLINRYSVIIVDPELFPDINVQGARDFVTFLFEEDTQEFIRDFGWDMYHKYLFYTYGDGE